MARLDARRLVVGSLWAATLLALLALSAVRFRAAVTGETPVDLATFVEAAGYARDGDSVYRAPAYVYLPYVAWSLIGVDSVDDAMIPWTIGSLLACWVAIAATTAALWRSLRAWQRPVVALVGSGTLLYSNVLALELWLGQSDTFILALASSAVAAASLRLPRTSGALIAIAGL